jgi:O-antigen ligase
MGAIERMLPIIVFPFLIFFFIDSISKRQIDKILTVFLLGCMAHSMYLNFEFLRLGLFENFQEATFYELPFREAVMNLDFEPLHPTYVSLWYCFAIAIAFSKLRDYKNQFLKTACVAAMFILLTTIVLLSSRIGLLCLATIGILYIFSVRNKKIKIVLLLLFAGVGLFSITKISLISSRMIAEFQQTELVPPVGKEHNSINIRIGIYKCAVNLIKQHVWLGVGIGDVQHELDTCYLNYQTDVYQSDNYNTHNFFLHSFLGAGFLAFLALVFMMWFFFDTGIRQKSILYISFVLIIFLGMLFENVLSRNHGIIFFGIFNTLFIQYYLLNPKYVDRGYSSLQQ